MEYCLVLLSVQFSSVAQLCPTLCDHMECSMPGFHVHHQLLEPTQTHVHRVGDAIQPSCPLSPSPSAFNLSQHQHLFQWVSSSHLVAKVLGVSASASVLPVNIQDWFPLGWTGWISLQSKGLSRVFSNTTGQKHQFLLHSVLFCFLLLFLLSVLCLPYFWKIVFPCWNIALLFPHLLIFRGISLLTYFISFLSHISSVPW